MKKTLALVLALVLLFSCAAFAEDLTKVSVMGYERHIADNVFFTERDGQQIWDKAIALFNAAGIDFDFEVIADNEQYKTTVQTRLATATDLPDMIYLGTMAEEDILDLADQGIILPMNEVLETTKGAAYEFFYNGEGQQAKNMISDAEGNFYWLPRIQINQLNGQNAGTSMGQCIRLDWLRKLNLEVPTTLDEYTNAIRAFQENDMNGNGVKDEVIVADTAYFENGINYWFGMVQGYIGVNVTEGKVESPWESPYIADYFTYIQSLVNEGLLYADAIGASADTSALLTENKIASEYYYPVGTYEEAPMEAAGIEGPIYIGIMPFAAVEGATPFYSEETPYLQYMRFGVTKAAADKLETIAKVYDTIYGDELLNLIDWGIEDVTYSVNEDGTRNRLNGTMSFAELWDAKISDFDHFARFFFPTLRHNDRADEIARTSIEYPDKGQFELDSTGWPYITPNDNTSYYALATTEEAEKLAELLPDLNTYSAEMAAKLSLGDAKIEEIPEIVEELKNLGLDEVIAIRQAQLDRTNGK